MYPRPRGLTVEEKENWNKMLLVDGQGATRNKSSTLGKDRARRGHREWKATMMQEDSCSSHWLLLVAAQGDLESVGPAVQVLSRH
jgi:hypothetical protein